MVALVCLFPSAMAQEDQTQLSMDFLEYLADMEDVNGEWIDATDTSNLAANDTAVSESSHSSEVLISGDKPQNSNLSNPSDEDGKGGKQ
ncbi:hypothetical protein KIH87_13015 [Paraneptunicella aestuarii]|uniref:hypothetical protein n=1 Tax=Paraneptunicella aestuarii TaxID=2831148 RepID=UPI001E3ED959|nr:hypothetical protein [Paraneptunicella aestuarii]UAA37628.1 hypothetical protein KIH87_13015 [Paraneptunicella aestuarii]